MALFVLHQNVKYLFTGALLAWLVSRLALFYPEHLDSALFGPAGALAFVQVFVLQGAGGLGLGGLWPAGSGNIGDLSLVPSASPLHVGALLSAGFVDLSTDTNWSLSPLLSFGALALGGLWSRRLGPHREIWSWDVVEITAIDLLGSEVISDHLWRRRPSPIGVTWGGGEVRLFRTGLAASHHHLSSTGARSYGPLGWAPASQTQLCWVGVTAVAAQPRCPTTPPLRVKARTAVPNANAPLAASEASLVAWSLTFFAPSSGAIAAWGLWGGPLYLWLLSVPLLMYFRMLRYRGSPALWSHAPLVPLAHSFATPLPWAPFSLAGQAFVGRTRRALAPNG